MARSKPELYPVHNLDEANQALATISELNRKLTSIESRMNDRIDKAKAGAAAEAAPLKLQVAEIEAGLQAYATANKSSLFKDKRSRQLDYGTIGFRKSKQIKPKPKHTWKMVLGLLKQMKFDSAVRIKEEVNKEELETWPDKRLDLVGARRVPKDQFWYETDEEKIADKQAA